MKTVAYTFFLFLFLLACCSCHAEDYRKTDPPSPPTIRKAEKQADGEVLAFLGADMLDFMKNPIKVETFRIDRNRKSSDIAGDTIGDTAGQTIQGYPVISKGRDLSRKELQQVSGIIRAASSYEFQWSKRTRIRPEFALRFAGDREYADIVIDFNSRQWAFSFRNLRKEEDISKSAGPILSGIIQAAFTE